MTKKGWGKFLEDKTIPLNERLTYRNDCFNQACIYWLAAMCILHIAAVVVGLALAANISVWFLLLLLEPVLFGWPSYILGKDTLMRHYHIRYITYLGETK